MRLRFSIRSLFLATFFTAMLASAGVYYYQFFVVPYKPIQWSELTPEKVLKLQPTDHPIVLHGVDGTFRPPCVRDGLNSFGGSSPNTIFRSFAHQNRVEFLHYDYTDHESTGSKCWTLIRNRLREQDPSVPNNFSIDQSIVLVLPDCQDFLIIRKQFPNYRDIMAAILSHGKELDGDSFFGE